MRLLSITALPFYPDTVGGADLSNHYLFRSLLQRGWEIEVICWLSAKSPYRHSLNHAWWESLVHFRKPPRFVLDENTGYPCWRGIRNRPHLRCFASRVVRRVLRLRSYSASGAEKFRACAPGGSGIVCEAELTGARVLLDQRLNQFAPDLVLGFSSVTSLLCHAVSLGYPSFQYAHGGSSNMKSFVYPDGIHLIANSPYVASLLSHASRPKVGVVLPGVDKQRYRVTQRERQYITFINPIPDKGLDVVMEVARQLPQERFLFVKGGWFDYNNHFINKFRMKRLYSLPNVEVWDFQHDMCEVYGMTDILLVPSRRESFGRVILEAHINGIPVIASNIGGIPFTLGQGGLLIDHQDNPQAEAQVYIKVLRRLRNDGGLYGELSARAIQNSLRPEFDPEHQVETFIRFVEERMRVS